MRLSAVVTTSNQTIVNAGNLKYKLPLIKFKKFNGNNRDWFQVNDAIDYLVFFHVGHARVGFMKLAFCCNVLYCTKIIDNNVNIYIHTVH